MASPKEVIKVGRVRLSVWEGEYDGHTTLSFTIDKPYKDKDNNYQSGKSFSKTDLGNVVLACIKATDVLYDQMYSETKPQTKLDDIPF